MKILISGGAGFIGSHLVEEYQGVAEIIVLDNFLSGKKENLFGFKYELVEGDICDRKLLRKILKGVDYVFHMAALVSVVESLKNPTKYTKVNTLGTLILLEECVSAKVKKICFSSSSAIYGENPESPKRENMKPQPLSPYAVNKLDGEYYCKIFNRECGLQTTILRYFNVFGPRQDPKSQYAAAIPIFVSRAIKNEDIVIYGDGEQTRDFVYVKDVVRANRFLAESSFTGVFNVAYGKSITINALAEKIISMTNSKSKIIHAEPRKGEIKHSLASIDKLLSTGFKTEYSFDNALQKTIEFFRKN